MIHILRSRILLFMLLAACSTPEQGSYPSGSMEYPHRGFTQRSSSYETPDLEGNNDRGIMAPGETLTLAELEGPGRITHIWTTMFGAERGLPRSIVLRMYWDGSESPAVETPIGDFFAAGHGMEANVNSALVATSSFGRARNCYWPMPFRKSARVTITNESDSEEAGIYWYIDWEKRKVPDDVPYFHARYRQENPVTPGKDYLIADIKGKGHYVGTVLSVRCSQPGWFGEGDDRFYIDGDSLPTIHGTGSEDYINDAWAFRVVNRPSYGVTIWEGMNMGSRITAYRWHTHDPVFFQNTLRFEMEHKGNTFYEDLSLADAYSQERDDFYSSVAFWYQEGPQKGWEPIPSFGERMYPAELLQAEELFSERMPAGVSLHEDQFYTNKKGICFSPTAIGQSLTLPFEIKEEGHYILMSRLWPRGDAGIYDFEVDDRLVLTGEDLWREHHFVGDLKLGHVHHLKKGMHRLKATYRGSSLPGGPGKLYVDALVLEVAGEFAAIDED